GSRKLRPYPPLTSTMSPGTPSLSTSAVRISFMIRLPFFPPTIRPGPGCREVISHAYGGGASIAPGNRPDLERGLVVHAAEPTGTSGLRGTAPRVVVLGTTLTAAVAAALLWLAAAETTLRLTAAVAPALETAAPTAVAAD